MISLHDVGGKKNNDPEEDPTVVPQITITQPGAVPSSGNVRTWSGSLFNRFSQFINGKTQQRRHQKEIGKQRLKHQATNEGPISQQQYRLIRANEPEWNSQYEYVNNKIRTAKYSKFTFIPRNLFEQFHRAANVYFLVLLILQNCPEMTSLSPITTLLPLMFVLLISAVKDGFDDYQRHKNDNRVNNRRCLLVRDGALVEEVWKNVAVGDIIKMECDDFVTADCLILSTSEPYNLCFVETKELDGETNLKVRNGLAETARLNNEQMLSDFDGQIKCEPPNNNLNRFEGHLLWQNRQYRLTNDNLLLRGCVVRNTSSVFCLVIFAGRDCKLVKNSGKTKLKRTNIDVLLNRQIVAIFILLLIICFFLTLGMFVPFLAPDINFQNSYAYIKKPGIDLFTAFVRFFSYLILLNTLVPISLVVTVEIFRFVNSKWINCDLKMYCAPSDLPANAISTTLSEQLGQIEFIFSDKTGTLTQNVMTFNKCSIDGVCYGLCIQDGKNIEITESNKERFRVSFAWNSAHEPGFYWFDQRLVDAAMDGKPAVVEFMRALSLCHTVMSNTKNGTLVYQAQSPDEGALVSAARNFGFVYKCRSPESVVIEINGSSEAYELICIIDFNSDRKRMSVMLQHRGRIFILSKGADSVMFTRLAPGQEEVRNKTQQHLDSFAVNGLRTLVICRREFEYEFFKEWNDRYMAANQIADPEERQRQLDAVYDEVEHNYTLLGATAIEDKLQQGVPETLHKLTTAGIKVWVLTGDKLETAVNIGFSCNLLTPSMQDFVIDSDDVFEVATRLKEIRHEISKFVPGQTPIRSYLSSGYLMSMSSSMTSFVVSSPSIGSHAPSPTPFAPIPQPNLKFGGFALVISGSSLEYALSRHMEDDFLAIAMKCTTVMCCRATPLQKSKIVEIAKNRFGVTTLAIGDGANDVGMIKTAHIGVGISGKEGMQAVYASDYSIAQFRYLQRLLFVHGRWSYRRMAAFLNFFFFKNFSFTILHIFFSFFCGFTAQPVLSEDFITVYNLFLTSWPVLILSCFEQDVNDFYSVALPRLYEPGKRNALFNWRAFLFSVLDGTFCAFVIMMTIFLGLHNSPISDMQSVMLAADTILMLLVTFRIAMVTNYWTGLHHFFIWGSLAFFFLMIFTVQSPQVFEFYPEFFDFMLVYSQVYTSPLFWLLAVVSITTCTLPIFAVKFYFWRIRPTLSVRARLLQQEVREKEFPTAMPRPPSTAANLLLQTSNLLSPRPRFSAPPSAAAGIGRHRSSFAFSQSEGYGKLITTGKLVQSWLVPGARDSLRLARNYSSVRHQLGVPDDSSGTGLRSRTPYRYQTHQRTVSELPKSTTPVTEQGSEFDLQSLRHSCEALHDDGDSNSRTLDSRKSKADESTDEPEQLKKQLPTPTYASLRRRSEQQTPEKNDPQDDVFGTQL